MALRFLAAGDFRSALRLYQHILGALPEDLDARMRVGDICVQVGQPHLAIAVYGAVAFLDLRGGRPLHALVAMQALTDLGEDVTPLHATLGQLYGADASLRIASRGDKAGTAVEIALPLRREPIVRVAGVPA